MSIGVEELKEIVHRVAIQQEINTNDISQITKDMKQLITASPDIAVMKEKIENTSNRLDSLTGAVRKAAITLSIMAISSIVGLVFTIALKG